MIEMKFINKYLSYKEGLTDWYRYNGHEWSKDCLVQQDFLYDEFSFGLFERHWWELLWEDYLFVVIVSLFY